VSRFAPLAISLAALGMLLIGQLQPETRLLVAGIPINTVIMGGCLIGAARLPVSRDDRAAAVCVLLLLVPISLSLFWSREPVAGALKILNLATSAVSVALMLRVAIGQVGLEQVLRWWLAAFWALLAAALVYKARYGFLSRDVNFFMNGPIVFARMMGIAALAAAYVYRGSFRWIAISCFSAAVLWTQSKGPFLALILAGAGVSILQLKGSRRGVAAVTVAAIVVGILIAAPWLEQFEFLRRFFVAASFLQQGIGGANYGSIGSRVEMVEQSLQLIAAEPLGVGLGSWAIRTGNIWAEYPHNFFLEVFSEGGLLLGGLSAIAFFLFLRTPSAVLASICWFLVLSQQFSGDLLDARFWLAFSVLAFMLPGSLAADGRRGSAAV